MRAVADALNATTANDEQMSLERTVRRRLVGRPQCSWFG